MFSPARDPEVVRAYRFGMTAVQRMERETDGRAVVEYVCNSDTLKQACWQWVLGEDGDRVERRADRQGATDLALIVQDASDQGTRWEAERRYLEDKRAEYRERGEPVPERFVVNLSDDLDV